MEKKHPHYYVLLVGINAYPMAGAELNGCIQDINRLEKYLHHRFNLPEPGEMRTELIRKTETAYLSLWRIQDSAATYENIIQAFRQHLRRANGRDTVWFHFSGHGSEQLTAEEFKETIVLNGKDQTLVCFPKAEEPIQMHLADKETAVLLHEVATQDETGAPKAQSPRIVVSMDCCHSGSGTRAHEDVLPDFGSRNYEFINNREDPIATAKENRPLSSYIEGFYEKQWLANQSFEVPLAPHVLMAACESVQTAGDAPFGGLFTDGLLSILDRSKDQINYADLLTQVRASVRNTSRKHRRSQTPQFESFGNFNPYTTFLTGEPLGTPLRYELEYVRSSWWIKCGAVHGLPLDSNQPIQVAIQTAAPENKALGLVEITKIGAVKSKLAVPKALGLEKGGAYQGVINRLPAPAVYIKLEGDQAAIESLKKTWDYSMNILPLENDEDSDLTVQLKESTFRIWNDEWDQLVIEEAYSNLTNKKIATYIEKVVRWNRTLNINNHQSGLIDHLTFDLGIASKNGKFEFVAEDKLQLQLDPNVHLSTQSGALGAFFLPRITIKDIQQPLYIYPIHMRRDYSISAYENGLIYRPEEYEYELVTIPLWTKKQGWGLSPGEETNKSYYKLWVTCSPFDHQQLLQSGIKQTRAETMDWSPVAFKDDWCVLTIEVEISRKN